MADTTIERKLVELEGRYWQALKDKDGDPFGRDRP